MDRLLQLSEEAVFVEEFHAAVAFSQVISRRTRRWCTDAQGVQLMGGGSSRSARSVPKQTRPPPGTDLSARFDDDLKELGDKFADARLAMADLRAATWRVRERTRLLGIIDREQLRQIEHDARVAQEMLDLHALERRFAGGKVWDDLKVNSRRRRGVVLGGHLMFVLPVVAGRDQHAAGAAQRKEHRAGVSGVHGRLAHAAVRH